MMEKDNHTTRAPKVDSNTAEKIVILCDLVLVNEDTLDFEKSKQYIEEHINNNITFNGDRFEIRSIVQNRISKYIEKCPNLAQLFTFKSDNNFQIFRIQFYEYYHYYYYSIKGRPSSLLYPIEFEYVFDAIQEAIDFYVLYENFSVKFKEDVVKQATQEIIDVTKKAVCSTILATKNAEREAENAANKAVESAIEKVVSEEKLDQKISEKVEKQVIEKVNEQIHEVDEQIKKVPSRVSENSVTILGIFSGIVLTVVAGLFYSSSVLENINSTNFFRLLGISALVGFVCLHLMVVMFRFITKISGKEKSSDNLIIFVSIVLIVVMLGGFVLQFVFPDKTSREASDVPNINADVDVNSSYSESNIIFDELSSTKDEPNK